MNNAQKLIAGLKNLSKEDQMKKFLEMNAEVMRDMPDELRQHFERDPIITMRNPKTGETFQAIFDVETGIARSID